jgi:hypothetical protein
MFVDSLLFWQRVTEFRQMPPHNALSTLTIPSPLLGPIGGSNSPNFDGTGSGSKDSPVHRTGVAHGPRVIANGTAFTDRQPLLSVDTSTGTPTHNTLTSPSTGTPKTIISPSAAVVSLTSPILTLLRTGNGNVTPIAAAGAAASTAPTSAIAMTSSVAPPLSSSPPPFSRIMSPSRQSLPRQAPSPTAPSTASSIPLTSATTGGRLHHTHSLSNGTTLPIASLNTVATAASPRIGIATGTTTASMPPPAPTPQLASHFSSTATTTAVVVIGTGAAPLAADDTPPWLLTMLQEAIRIYETYCAPGSPFEVRPTQKSHS